MPLEKNTQKQKKEATQDNSNFLFEYFKLFRFKILRMMFFSTYFMVFKGNTLQLLSHFIFHYFLYIFFSTSNKHKFPISQSMSSIPSELQFHCELISAHSEKVVTKLIKPCSVKFIHLIIMFTIFIFYYDYYFISDIIV